MTDKPDMGPVGYTAQLIADDIINMIDKLGLQHIHAVGHSFGSLILQVLAIRQPQSFADYTLIDTTVDCRSNPVLLKVKYGEKGGFCGLENCSGELSENFLWDWTHMDNESEELRIAEFEHVKQMPLVAWKNLMNGLLQFNSSDFIGNIKGDVLVLWGTEDNIFTQVDQDKVRAGLTGCHVEYINVDGASHNGFWDSIDTARTYAEHILNFINRQK